MNALTTQKKVAKLRKEKSDLYAAEVLNYLVRHREENMSNLTLTELANELGFKHASSAMRVEKETFKLTLSRFFELCQLYNLKPTDVINKIQNDIKI